MSKPHISPSQIDQFFTCAYEYKLNRIDKIKRPSGVNRLVGTTSHDAAETDLGCKAITGVLMPTDIVQDAARTYFNKNESKVQEETGFEITYSEDETRGSAIDMSVRLSTLYHSDIAPLVNPVGIETTFKLDTGSGFPFNLLGRADILEENFVRDIKTVAATPNKNVTDRHAQGIFYSLAFLKAYGRQPVFAIDALVKLKTPKAVTITAEYDEQDYEMLFRRIETMSDLISKGAFMPASPTHWKCSEKYCDYFTICEYGAKQKVQI